MIIMLLSGCVDPQTKTDLFSDADVFNKTTPKTAPFSLPVPPAEGNCTQSDVWGWICTEDSYPPLPVITRQEYESMRVPRQLIGHGHSYWLVCSPSMYPIVTCLDTYVAVVPEDNRKMKIGDIIFYSKPGMDYQGMPLGFVVHRIKEIGTDIEGIYYVTKGDHVIVRDPWIVRPNQVYFEVVGRYG